MNYRKSSARIRFDHKAQSLKMNARMASMKPYAVNHDVQQLVFHAAIFELSAAFEEYISELIEGWIFLAKDKKRKVSVLPWHTRYFLFSDENLRHFQDYFYRKDEKGFIEALYRSSSSSRYLDSRYNIPDYISGSAILKDKKFPSSRNLRVVFFRAGVSNIFHEINRLGRRDYESILDSFMDIRSEIAHESPRNLTISDIKEKLDQMMDLVKRLDRAFCYHVTRHSGIECWQK